MADPIDKTPVVVRVRWKEEGLGMKGKMEVREDGKSEIVFEFELGIADTQGAKERAQGIAMSRGVACEEKHFEHAAGMRALEKVKQMILSSMVISVNVGKAKP